MGNTTRSLGIGPCDCCKERDAQVFHHWVDEFHKYHEKPVCNLCNAKLSEVFRQANPAGIYTHTTSLSWKTQVELVCIYDYLQFACPKVPKKYIRKNPAGSHLGGFELEVAKLEFEAALADRSRS